jgi:hypothetical protein
MWDEPLIMSGPKYRSRVLAPRQVVFDRDGRKFRGAQVWALEGDNITLRIQMEPAYVRDRVVSRSLIESEPEGMRAAMVLGAPVIVKVEGSTPDDYVVVAVRGGRPSINISDEASLVRSGTFAPSLLNGIIRGVPDYLD